MSKDWSKLTSRIKRVHRVVETKTVLSQSSSIIPSRWCCKKNSIYYPLICIIRYTFLITITIIITITRPMPYSLSHAAFMWPLAKLCSPSIRTLSCSIRVTTHPASILPVIQHPCNLSSSISSQPSSIRLHINAQCTTCPFFTRKQLSATAWNVLRNHLAMQQASACKLAFFFAIIVMYQLPTLQSREDHTCREV